MILLVTPGSAKASQSDSWVWSSPVVWYLYMAKAKLARLPRMNTNF